MDSGVPEDDDFTDVRKSTSIPSHGTIPKWLDNITQKVTQSREHYLSYPYTKRSNHPYYDLDATAKNSSTQFTEDSQEEEDPDKNEPTPVSSAKFGRRASLASQLLADVPSKNVILTKSDYLIPRLEKGFDFKDLHPQDSYELDLEKSWKSLDKFKQSHKGRLDSAKDPSEKEEPPMNFEDWVLSPISDENGTTPGGSSSYSPSLLEQPNTAVPKRCKSEMSNYLPIFNAIHNDSAKIHHQLEETHKENLPITADKKSKSTENVFVKPTEGSEFVSRSHNRPSKNKFDSEFERKLSDYQMKVDKENQLREEIISELLSENELITEKLRMSSLSLEDELLYGDSGDFSLHGKLYNSNSKYVSKSSKKDKNEKVFIIPELPSGRTLVIDILSTWGDKYYVGLNGIEIFGVDGNIVEVKKIAAVPPDVNVLPECNNDPRVVPNLLDGINRTQDDMHIWLAPFEMGCSHIITVEFEKITTLSMIRIWNYNKSRIHSYRGVRDIVMFLDGAPIFKGEIAKACGGILGGVEAFGDTILFTTDDAILENISRHDTSFSFLTSEPTTPVKVDRPPTATLTSEVRPITRPAEKTSPASTAKASPIDQILLGASQIDLIFLSNWGHSNSIGLTSLEVIQESDSVINLSRSHVSCSNRDGNAFLPRLFNGINITDEPENMWCAPYKYDQQVVVSISFDGFKYISGIRLWNYNANLEMSYAGVRAMKVLLDNKPVQNPITNSEIFILRRAPGNQHYDFVQDIKFVEDSTLCHNHNNEPSVMAHSCLSDQNELFYEPSTMPEGFVFQIIVFSSWGDQYYCGLNGIELYNQFGTKIHLDEQNICAYPESVNSLPNISGDIRTPDKLIDGINDDKSGSHSWLAPIVPKHLNRIYIVMDQPIIVSYIKLWNYSKTPNRGVKEFGVLIDDLLVYNGTLDKYSNNSENYQTIVFTEDENIIGDESRTLVRNGGFSQDVILLDQDMRATTGGSLPEADPALRPFTSVSPFNRGYTSFSH